MFSLHHIAISVKDIEKSVSFYQKLGFREVLRYISEDNSLIIVNMKLGEVFLEIFHFSQFKENPQLDKELWDNLKIVGIKHFALKTEDIYKTLKELKKAGIASPSTSVKKGRTGILYFFIKDPDGNFVEIVQDDRNL